jgi:hypothetical protein
MLESAEVLGSTKRAVKASPALACLDMANENLVGYTCKHQRSLTFPEKVSTLDGRIEGKHMIRLTHLTDLFAIDDACDVTR